MLLSLYRYSPHGPSLHNIGDVTARTDQDHLIGGYVIGCGLAKGLPLGAVVQYDCLTQVAHREYVRKED